MKHIFQINYISINELNTMKKLLFALAICGFALTSCGNKTKAAAGEKACCPKVKTEVAASEEKACCSKAKTEATAELKKDSTKCCASKAESTKSCCKK